MRVQDLLTGKNSRLVMIRMNEPVEMAIRLLRRENIGALIVKDVVRTEGNTAVGVFSERDVLRALDQHGAAALKLPISRLMSVNIISCSPDDETDDVLALMLQHHIRHVPVFESGNVIGMISIRDILSAELRKRAPRAGASPQAQANEPAIVKP
jgi:CBS domain-containing protein